MSLNQIFRRALLILPLIFASFLAVAMVYVRLEYSGQWRYIFLVWNLFLAWLPFVFAVLAYRFARHYWLVLPFGFLWLLFLPNAPYMITDLLHLQPLPQVPLWYDVIMIFTFALTGLLLGFLSLYLMQTLVVRRFGPTVGWLFVFATLGLSGLGVYIGRFLRWNSWDLFTDPFYLMQHLIHALLVPLNITAAVIALLLSALFILAYGAFFTIPNLAIEMQREP